MFFPVEDIPKKRLYELEQNNAEIREYEGKKFVIISKAEAMRYRNENKPYTLSVSAELL